MSLESFRYELQDMFAFRARYAFYVVIAAALVILSGWLVEGSVPINIVVFKAGLAAFESEKLVETVRLIPSVNVIVTDAAPSPEILHQADAALGVGKILGKLTAIENVASSQAGYLAEALRSIPQLPDTDSVDTYEADQESTVALLARILAAPQSTNLLLDAGRRPFLPAMIALLTVFAPFFIAVETYARHRDTGLLAIRIAASQGRTSGSVLARLLGLVLIGCLLLLVLLAVSRVVYGVAGYATWPLLVLGYLPAAICSASVGSIVGFWTRGSRVLSLSAGYLFALVIFGGLFAPLAVSAQPVQWISTIVPTRYFLPILRRWMFEGQMPFAAIGPAPAEWFLLNEAKLYGIVTIVSLVVFGAATALWRRRL